MYANTCWGFLGLAVTFGLAVLGLPADYGWLQPWLFGAAVISGVTSVICFLWPLIYRAARTLRKQISGPQHLLTSPSLILPDEAFGLGQWIYFESRSIRAPDGGETKLYETKFYIVVSNTLESGHTLKNVQVEISGYGVPVFAPILGAAGSAIDLKHGRMRRDNQDGNPATIRMRIRRCRGDEGRA